MKTLKVVPWYFCLHEFSIGNTEQNICILFRRAERMCSIVNDNKDGKIIAEVDVAVSETVAVWGKYAKKVI
jgi:hypothetical protein